MSDAPESTRSYRSWILASAPLFRPMHMTTAAAGPFRRSALVAVLLATLPLTPGSGLGAQTAADMGPFPEGRTLVEADFDGSVLNLWVYKPANYVGDGFILLLHGASRAAEAYRDNAGGFADAFGRLVVVPEFDAERFPSRLYQFGGVFREDGSFADAEERTFAYVPKLVGYIRDREGAPELPYLLLGYSAGAQFVARMAAFLDTEEAQLPRGTAFDQGVHRFSRNLRWFNTAMDLAHERGWEFNWRLVLAHGAGHAPPEMFDHPQIGNALFGHR